MNQKKSYVPPRLSAHDPKTVPEWMKLLREDVLADVAPACTAVVDLDRKYVHVSEGFCELVGLQERGIDWNAVRSSDRAEHDGHSDDVQSVFQTRMHARPVGAGSSHRIPHFDSLRGLAPAGY